MEKKKDIVYEVPCQDCNMKYQHSIDWDSARVQATARGYWSRRTLEAIQIHRTPHPMNLDCGLHLSPVWNLLMDLT